MDDVSDDDAPPLLVRADGQRAANGLESDMDELKMKRVPITIITGK